MKAHTNGKVCEIHYHSISLSEPLSRMILLCTGNFYCSISAKALNYCLVLFKVKY